MRFVHCADIHLGRQQFGLAQRWQDFGDAFEYIVDYTIGVSADCMLIAGDLFHERAINASTLSQARDILGRLKERDIPVFAIEGNHDKALYKDKESWMQYLSKRGYITLLKPVLEENTVLLRQYEGHAGSIAYCKGVRIIGLGYLGVTTAERIKAIAEVIEIYPQPTVIMLHAAVDRLLSMDMAGVSMAALEGLRQKADYIALGHIHSRYEKDFIYNPGAPECVHIDEAGGEKGFFDVRLTQDSLEAKFIPSRRRDVRYCVIDVSNASGQEEVCACVMEKVGEAEGCVLRITFVGKSSHGLLDTVSICDAVKQNLGCLHVEALNMLDLPGREPHSFSKEELELGVIEDMLALIGGRWTGIHDLPGLILGVKESLLTGADAGEVAEAIIAAAGEEE